MNLYAVELPPVPNVELNGDQITWSALEGATGYNVYQGNTYLSTVIDDFAYTVTDVGRYSIVAFYGDGDFGALRGSTFVDFEDSVDNRPLTFQIADEFAYVTRRCTDVAAGESCEARCPDLIGSTTVVGGIIIGDAAGGACSSSDNLPMNSSIAPDGYTCTVSLNRQI